jgi:MoxR-like ATPase
MPDTQTRNLEALEELAAGHRRIMSELRKVIVGQDQVIDELMTALFANGHCLLVGVPGLAKTLLIHSLADVLDLKFSRIQFTPDLMPSDVTAGGQTWNLEAPFYVLATQNPIEQEGTYPLPEAQLDRFMFHVRVGYPSQDEEVAIVNRTTGGETPKLERVLSAEDIIRFQNLVRRVPASPFVVEYAVRLARATRPDEDGSEQVKRYVSWGAGPRASQFLILGAKTWAAMNGSVSPSCEDVRRVARPVLRHRVVTNFSAEAEGVSTEHIIDDLLKTIPETPSGKK